jgi:hypothetical protein
MSETSEEVWASRLTITVWLPATAVELADERVRTVVSELDPSISAITPIKSVRALTLVLRAARSVPMEVKAVSSELSVVSWVVQGVSTDFRLATMLATVVVTSKPAPLVAEPKLIPTAPMSYGLYWAISPYNS